MQRNRAASRRDSETGSVANEMRARGAELAGAALSDAVPNQHRSILTDRRHCMQTAVAITVSLLAAAAAAADASQRVIFPFPSPFFRGVDSISAEHLAVESYTVFIRQQSYLLLFGIPSPTHSFFRGLKPSFSANPSHCSPSFLLLKY